MVKFFLRRYPLSWEIGIVLVWWVKMERKKYITEDYSWTSGAGIGTMIITSGHKTGYLPQEMVANFETTVWEEAMNAFTEQMGLLKKIDHTTRELSERSDYESESYIKLTQQLADANERFHLIGGHTMEAETEKVLLGLGFPAQDFDRPLKEYSSGWQMRVALAKILLQKPEILLLDEPTHHLDIESIQWLEEYLANYDGALLLVSHDRTFWIG